MKNDFLELGENVLAISEPLQIGHMRLHFLHHLLALRRIAHIEHLLYNIIRELILKRCFHIFNPLKFLECSDCVKFMPAGTRSAFCVGIKPTLSRVKKNQFCIF